MHDSEATDAMIESALQVWAARYVSILGSSEPLTGANALSEVDGLLRDEYFFGEVEAGFGGEAEWLGRALQEIVLKPRLEIRRADDAVFDAVRREVSSNEEAREPPEDEELFIGAEDRGEAPDERETDEGRHE